MKKCCYNTQCACFDNMNQTNNCAKFFNIEACLSHSPIMDELAENIAEALYMRPSTVKLGLLEAGLMKNKPTLDSLKKEDKFMQETISEEMFEKIMDVANASTVFVDYGKKMLGIDRVTMKQCAIDQGILLKNANPIEQARALLLETPLSGGYEKLIAENYEKALQWIAEELRKCNTKNYQDVHILSEIIVMIEVK